MEGSGASGESFLRLYFKTMVKTKKTLLDYTWLSMIAEIGGYTGLLLGVSVVNVTGLVGNCLQRRQRRRAVQKRESTQNSTILGLK